MDYSRTPRRKPQVEPAPDAPSLPPEAPMQEPPQRDRTSPYSDPFARPPRDTLTLGQRRRERKARKAAAELPAAIPRDQVRQIYVSWRWLSLLIVVMMAVTLFVMFRHDAFFVHSISVGYNSESRFITPPEVFERTGIAEYNLFWIDGAEVERKLEQDAQIANAEVSIGWPPNLVEVLITERQPALIWEQSGQRVWVDVRGRVMALRQDLPLVRVVVEKPSRDIHLTRCDRQGTSQLLGAGDCIDQDTVNGVLQFKALYPGVNEMVYDPVKGLGFRDGRNWVLWIGSGTDISTKMVVYNAIVADACGKGRKPIEVSVIDPDRPYYSWADKQTCAP